MTYRQITGDLFTAGLPAIGHGCNCAGSMGGGIAREVRHRFPALYEAYADACSHGSFQLGSFTVWQAPDLLVYNLATQVRPGRHAELGAIGSSVQAALDDVALRGLTALGLPRLGAGIGGLAWADVSQVLQDAASRSAVELVVVTRA